MNIEFVQLFASSIQFDNPSFIRIEKFKLSIMFLNSSGYFRTYILVIGYVSMRVPKNKRFSVPFYSPVPSLLKVQVFERIYMKSVTEILCSNLRMRFKFAEVV
jgi:hypothetical protein